MSLTPAERSLRGRLAAYTLHSQRDSRAHTEPAREAFLARFEKEVDPTGALSPEERARRADAESVFPRARFQVCEGSTPPRSGG